MLYIRCKYLMYPINLLLKRKYLNLNPQFANFLFIFIDIVYKNIVYKDNYISTLRIHYGR